MTTPRKKAAVAASLLLAIVSNLRADPPPPVPATQDASPPPTESKAEGAVMLNPFEVNSTKDAGYGATESNSITQFRTNLYKSPIVADVFNQEFLNDLNITSPEQAVLMYGGGGVQTNDAGAAGAFNTRPGDNTGSTNLSLRGDKVAVHRDGFIAATYTTNGLIGSTDTFAVERVEVINGASSLLYGDSGGGGVANIVSKQARFDTPAFGSASYSDDQFGSKRGTFDYGVGSQHFAIRVALVDADSKFDRFNLGGPQLGRYLQLAYRLGDKTVIRVTSMRATAFADNAWTIGNINNFLPTKDPRDNLNLRYLVATNQLSGLTSTIFGPGLNLNNVDSFAGWWKSDREEDSYSLASVETRWNPWLSTEVVAVNDDSTSDKPSGLGSLTPAAGLTGSGTNPLNQTAVNLSTPGDGLSNGHRMGLRAAAVMTGEFFHDKAHSQTITGAEIARQYVSSGISYVYALADAQGNVIINPNTLAVDNGMTVLTTSPSLWWGVQNGLNSEPLFKPGTPMITLADPNNPGQYLHYVHVARRTGDPSLVSTANPSGVNGSAGSYSRQDVQTHSYYIANQTDWYGDRLETLLGLRYSDQFSQNIGVNSSAVSRVRNEAPTFTTGASYGVNSWMRVFANLSTSSNPQLNTQNPYGTPNLSSKSKSPIPDIGIKIQTESVGFVLDWFPDYTLEDDAVGIDGTYVTQINPTGVNGPYEPYGLAPNSQVNVDRKAQGLSAKLNIHTKFGYDAYFNLGFSKATYLDTVKFNQVYNDQFRLNSGTVVYADGVTPVMVDPNAKGATTGLIPLTLAMLNTVNGPWWANPNVDSGAISSSVVRTALSQADPANPAIGPSGTGATGLPLSAIQYNWSDPNGHKGVITVIQAGDKQIGVPEYTFAWVNKYTFNHGPLNGLVLGGALQVNWDYANNYGLKSVIANNTVNADAVRYIFYRPTVAIVNNFITYRRKFYRYTWSVQLNVANTFNHYEVLTPPNTAVTPANNNYLFTAEPRTYTIKTGIDF